MRTRQPTTGTATDYRLGIMAGDRLTLFSASSHACFISVTLALFTFTTSRSSVDGRRALARMPSAGRSEPVVFLLVADDDDASPPSAFRFRGAISSAFSSVWSEGVGVGKKRCMIDLATDVV